MSKASPVLIAVALVLILTSSLTAQTHNLVGPELLNTPSIFIPDEAELSGLGGLVRVRLSIDENGNVTSVEQVTGPGWTCPHVSSPDVVAMREAATKAAMLGEFRPATLDGVPRSSSITLNFDFPPSESRSEKTVSALTGPIIPVERNSKFLASTGGPRRKVPFPLSGGVLNGKADSLVMPVWPACAYGLTGTVAVQVLIDTNVRSFRQRQFPVIHCFDSPRREPHANQNSLPRP